MRTDMFKVIVERPRWGAGHAASPKLKRTKDYTLKTIGHKRHAIESTRYTKGFNENLAPLVRFLRSRCGQRWDDVFSEICAQLDTGSTMKMHVRQHIEDFVLARISIGRYGKWLFEGEILGSNERRYRRRQFFVDPTDGVLREQRFLSECLPVANRIMGAAHHE
ncbi:hypothetical protein ATDW_03860 [Asticcacaulis sp. DW145]|uniref:Uncharacterized protein n=1 Tax=Asticcacaulis currens TaxID=2984210 RepID=A0ABT5IDY3_9CAUL|nr:hypothetical protein [Asticcacaulis currens]MDC7694153.1 hypothetical protein [Asticcacaulis currens]BEV09890.1 hypothetical protein ATDW_03860 [Asticcacaulis sp. DW145]